MRQKFLLSILLFSGVSTVIGQIVPYTRPAAEKKNPVGAYPKLRNSQPWDGLEPGTYNLKFKINGVKPGDTVYLADYHLDGKYMRDTAVVDKSGVAAFEGKNKLQRGMYIFVMPGKRGYFDFIVDDDQDFLISTDTAYYTGDYYNKMKVKGSEENEAFVAYQVGKSDIVQKIIDLDEEKNADTTKAGKEAFKNKRQALIDKKNNYDNEYIKAHPKHILSRFLYAMSDIDVPQDMPLLPDGTRDSAAPYRYYKAHYWDHIDFNEDALTRMPVNILKQKLDIYFDKVILPDADSCIKTCAFLLDKSKNSIEVEKYLVWYLTNRFETSNIMGLDKVFVYMAKNTYCAGKAWWTDSATIDKMCENAYRRASSLIGETAATLELQDPNGNWINTSTIQAPYTILIFWDPTCGHCREIVPKLGKIYEQNKDRGWRVIALYPNDKKKEFAEFKAQHPEINGFVNLMRGEVRSQYYADQLQKYYVIASPTIFILDENKTILANRIDVEKIVEFIDHMDKMKAAQSKSN